MAHPTLLKCRFTGMSLVGDFMITTSTHKFMYPSTLRVKKNIVCSPTTNAIYTARSLPSTLKTIQCVILYEAARSGDLNIERSHKKCLESGVPDPQLNARSSLKAVFNHPILQPYNWEVEKWASRISYSASQVCWNGGDLLTLDIDQGRSPVSGLIWWEGRYPIWKGLTGHFGR